LIQEGFPSASTAYNDAIEKSCNDLMVFVHQDLVLPRPWLRDIDRAVGYLEASDPNWGVLGCWGATLDSGYRGFIYSAGLGILGAPFKQPAAVTSLDEIVLILRKKSGLRFDDALPYFHFYGTDICLRAAQKGRKNYAISAFCMHNTQQGLVLPKEFYVCGDYIRRVWRDRLPIQTTCVRITKYRWDEYISGVREIYLRYVLRRKTGGTRIEQPLTLLDELVNKMMDAGMPEI
jgi:hypothetical protein